MPWFLNHIFKKTDEYYIIGGMVKDITRNLIAQTSLDEKLKDIRSMEGRNPELSSSFLVDKVNSHFIEVLSGTAQVATTWREMPESNEVLSLLTVKAGESVLFLPGEPRLIKPCEGSELSEFVLE